MCTILVLNHVHPDHPVVIAANRDEYYARPATGPQVLSVSPRVVGGLDRVGSGTWMGVSAGGRFAGLTNQRTWKAPDQALRSRGEVVLGVLQAGSTQEGERWLRCLHAGDFNPFNLLFGDAGGLKVAYARGDVLSIEDVPPGLHVLPNDRLDSPDFPKVARASARLRNVPMGTWDDLATGLARVLSDHELPPPEAIPEPPPGAVLPRALVRLLEALCIHTPLYGTRSSSLVALAPGRVTRYLHASGPPCRTAFQDHTALVAA